MRLNRAYFAAQTLVNQLRGFSFEKRLSTGNEQDWVLQFRRGDEIKLAVWSAVSKGRTAKIPLGGEFEAVDISGAKTGKFNAQNGLLEIPLSPVVNYLTPSKNYLIKTRFHLNTPRVKLPNIVYIHSHDTGRFVSPYGHTIRTPNIQKLAETGVLFRQEFCALPSCSPSRAALLTGQSPHSSGMLGLAHRGWKLHDYGQHLIHTLRKSGYHSALCGVQHISAGPDSVKIIGYDEEIKALDARARHVAPSAVQWLENAPQEPFFLDVGFVETHTLPNDKRFGDSLFGCEKGDPRFALPAPTMPDTPRTRQDMADFAEAARVLDDGIGEVLQALEAAGLAENTLIICTTDHGIPLPAMKCNLTDAGTGVSLILRGPDLFGGGVVCDAMISQIDLFPTLCEWLQIEKPEHLQGQSFLPVLRGESEEINEQIFSEVTHHAAYEPMRSVRTKRWKYIRQFDHRGRVVLPNVDDSPSKDIWIESGWRERKVEGEQLFDLTFDPHETNNLASDSAYATLLAEMRERLKL